DDAARGDLRPARHAHPAATRQRELRQALARSARQRPARASGGAVRRSVALLAGTSLTATLVVAAPTARQPPADDASQPVFRADVAVVSLNVTVTDKSSRYIQGLEQSDFSVFEDGVKQDVIFFSGAQLPTALALLIDTSASMNERMATAQEAAIGFVSRMQEGDLATVIDFDSRAEILQTFTSSKDDLVAAIRRTTAGG